jgi:hypothetical protein
MIEAVTLTSRARQRMRTISPLGQQRIMAVLEYDRHALFVQILTQ